MSNYLYHDSFISRLTLVIITLTFLNCGKKENVIDYKSYFSFSPIVIAVIDNDLHGVESEIKKGANVNETYGPYNRSILHTSAETSYNISLLLIRHGANLNYTDSGRKAPLHCAVQSKNYRIVKLLITSGATVDIKDNGLETPLHKAVKKGHCRIADYLIKKGANVNANSNVEITPLQYAVQSESICVTKLLLRNGANVNTKDYNGMTPLHYAVMLNNVKIVKLLLQYNANPLVPIGKDGYWILEGIRGKKIYSENETPLSIAEAKKNKKIIKLLKAHARSK